MPVSIMVGRGVHVENLNLFPKPRQDPVKFRLISLEAAVTILKLSMAAYPPGSWTNCSDSSDSSEILTEESWVLRSTLCNWVWRLISELKDVRDECKFVWLMVVPIAQSFDFDSTPDTRTRCLTLPHPFTPRICSSIP